MFLVVTLVIFSIFSQITPRDHDTVIQKRSSFTHDSYTKNVLLIYNLYLIIY